MSLSTFKRERLSSEPDMSGVRWDKCSTSPDWKESVETFTRDAVEIEKERDACVCSVSMGFSRDQSATDIEAGGESAGMSVCLQVWHCSPKMKWKGVAALPRSFELRGRVRTGEP